MSKIKGVVKQTIPSASKLKKLNKLFVKTSTKKYSELYKNNKEYVNLLSDGFNLVPRLIIYHMFGKKNSGYCELCLVPCRFKSYNEGYTKYCPKCAISEKALKFIMNKRKKQCREKYGVDHINQTKEMRKQISESAKSFERNEKRRKTCQEKYGVDHPSQTEKFWEKFKNTSNKNRGFDHPSQDPKIKAKIVKTNMKRYGVRNAMQNSTIVDYCMAQNYRVHSAKIDGKIFEYQGYELYVIQLLVDKYGVKKVTTKKTRMPEIWYTVDNIQRRYFPDIMVGNTFYEVKSKWTFGKADSTIYKNLQLKAKACIDAGYKFKCVVVSEYNGELILCASKLNKNANYYHRIMNMREMELKMKYNRTGGMASELFAKYSKLASDAR